MLVSEARAGSPTVLTCLALRAFRDHPWGCPGSYAQWHYSRSFGSYRQCYTDFIHVFVCRETAFRLVSMLLCTGFLLVVLCKYCFEPFSSVEELHSVQAAYCLEESERHSTSPGSLTDCPQVLADILVSWAPRGVVSWPLVAVLVALADQSISDCGSCRSVTVALPLSRCL